MALSPSMEQTFHAELYLRLEGLHRGGIGESWWDHLLIELGRWNALRGKGHGRRRIRERGLSVLPRIAEAYESLSAIRSISDAAWPELAPLFDIASSLKPTKTGSPVFPSKFCHFIRPDLYFVIDQAVIGLRGRRSYSVYWESCADGWRRAERSWTALEAVLRGEIRGSVLTGYPFPTKITELCLIGAA